MKEEEERTYAVETKELSKEFDGLVAVNRLDLRIDSGVMYGLIGPNGSGKTTTIKMLVGRLRPTRGEAFVLGEKVPVIDHISDLGFMPQEMAIYPDLTVAENLELFGALYGITRQEYEAKEKELLAMVDLEERRESLVSQLSGGMKHRVSLACSMVHDPEMLFLDEPTVGVDPELRIGFWDHFSELKAMGRTVIITTHYMDEASRCDVVGMMRQGRLIAEGTPEELLRRSGKDNLEDAFLEFSRRDAG
jgi:ABC-2 type transport system ATP-binding protein